jgi:nucleoside-triphosphatase THEP1
VNSSLLFIEGKPGSGKSTLVRYFIDNLRADGAIVAKFFYSHWNGDHRKMLQSLLGDILDADKSFFIHFEQAYRNLEDAEFGWPYETLKKTLRDCLTHPLKRKLFLIIDAMDESDGADRADIIQFLQDLSVSTDKECVMRIFLASRPINEFHLHHASRSHRILLQEKNREDIENCIHEFLQQ